MDLPDGSVMNRMFAPAVSISMPGTPSSFNIPPKSKELKITKMTKIKWMDL